MRLPWPFARSRDASSPPAADPVPDRPAVGDAWRGLPPLGDTIGPPPLVAPARPFAEAMAANNPPPPIVSPLSHGRSLEAPRGLVVGIARPTAAAPRSAMPAPVQRSPLAAARRAPDSIEPGDALEPSPPAAERDVARTAPAVVAAGSSRPTARSLTRTADQPLVRPLPGLVGQPRPAAGPRGLTRNVAEPAIQRAPLVQSTLPPTAAGPALAPEAPRQTLGQTRRRGLGAPIGGGPVGASPQLTEAASPVAPTASPASEARTEPPMAASPTLATPIAPDLTVAARPSIGRRPSEPEPEATARPVLGAGPAAPLTRAGPASAGAAPRSADPSRVSRRDTPLASGRSLLAGVQRAPLAVSVTSAGGDAPAVEASADHAPGPGGASGSQVRVHRGPEVASRAAALDARSFTRAGEIYLPASHGPLDRGSGRALLAHELTHVAQQTRLGSALPAEHTPHGQVLESEAVAAERSGGLPLALPSRPVAEPPPAGTGPGGPAQRAPFEAATQSADVTTITLPGGMQRAPVQRAAEQGGPDHRGSRRGHSEQELEELAGQLYARIGRRLRREILVDRERSGLALDLP